MPAVDEKKRKRKRARKFRTAGVDGEAAPAGDDSGSEPEVAAKVVENKEKKQKKNRAAVDEQETPAHTTPHTTHQPPATESTPSSSPSNSPPPPQLQAQTKPPSTPTAFESLYLRALTQQYANDLDSLRRAPDFRGDASVKVLVKAMGLGVECFGEAERALVVSGRGVL